MKKFTYTKDELGEQDAAAGSTTTSSDTKSSAPTMSKWESGRKYGKTYMNDPKYKWSSDRVFGKTYMNDPKYKWESGLTRGKANPLT